MLKERRVELHPREISLLRQLLGESRAAQERLGLALQVALARSGVVGEFLGLDRKYAIVATGKDDPPPPPVPVPGVALGNNSGEG